MDSVRRAIDQAIAAGHDPYSVKSGRVILKTSSENANEWRRHIFLAEASGKLTPAGEYFYAQTNTARPNGVFDPNQPLIHRGDSDYIKTRTGERKVRTMMPDGTLKVTALGKSFFKATTPRPT